MEETHQKKIEDLQRQHQRELEKLREEKDRLLAEETAATISGGSRPGVGGWRAHAERRPASTLPHSRDVPSASTKIPWPLPWSRGERRSPERLRAQSRPRKAREGLSQSRWPLR